MQNRFGTWIAVLGGFLALGLVGASQAVEIAPGKLGKDDAVLVGDAKCTTCHDETEKYPVLAIGKTKHGTVADGRTPTCVSCHGPSENHMRKLAGQKERPKPDVSFGGHYLKVDVDAQVDKYFGRQGKGTTTPVADRNASCLTCHSKGGKQMFWATSTHANNDVACTSCHQIHTAHDKTRDKNAQTELCFSCHKDRRAEVMKPSHHPIMEGKVACSDCHNPHGSPGPKQLVKGSVNETCHTCHMEKRGPFIHNHQPVSEDCTICHNPHGSTVANLLKSRPPFLCQQCHEAAQHPTSYAGLPIVQANGLGATGRGQQVAVGRGCANCHTNIHGSNSPQNATAVRRFLR